MDKIKIVYIDDDIETELSEYLEDHFKFDGFEVLSSEREFRSDESYERLINDSSVRTADIILLDSKLFENGRVTENKYTGEELMLVLKKLNPYLEVIIITQNELVEDLDMVAKYDLSFGVSAKEHYDLMLAPKIESAIRNVLKYRKLVGRFIDNSSWEDLLKKKILATLQGTQQYDPLTKSDVDNIIVAFKEIEAILNG